MLHNLLIKMKKVLLLLSLAIAANLHAQITISFEFDDTPEINDNSTLGAAFKLAVNGKTTATTFDLSSIFSGLELTVTPSQEDISHTMVGLGIKSGGTFSAVGDSLAFSFNEAIKGLRLLKSEGHKSYYSLKRNAIYLTSITKASKKQMSEYMRKIKHHAAESNIVLTAPDMEGLL